LLLRKIGPFVILHLMKYRVPKRRPASLLALAVASLAIISCLSSTFKPPQVAQVDGCLISPSFEMPPELRGSEPLKIKDGEYSLGPWRIPAGVIELKIVVLRGRETEFFTLDGKRLKEATGPVPQKILDCAKQLVAAADQRTLFQLVMDSLVLSAEASCSRCRGSVRFVADTERRYVYGYCHGASRPCSGASY